VFTFDKDFIHSFGGGASMESFSTPLGASSQPFNNESDDYYVHETTQVHQQHIPNANQVVRHQLLPLFI
jgi:hypothetical protein